MKAIFLRSALLFCFAVYALSLTKAADPADPTIGEWKTFGNGPSHTGFYPASIGTAGISAAWSKTLGVAINQVAISGDKIFLTTNAYFGSTTYAAALSIADGSELWRYPMPQAFSLNSPTYDSGRVLFQRCDNYSDTYLYALNSNSGALLWAAPHAAQWERYEAPTVFGDGVWIEGGSYGGMYGFDLATGTQRFFVSLPQEDQWTPSYYGGVIYSCVGGILKANDPRSGSDLWTRDLRVGGASWYNAGVLSIMNDRAFVIGGGSLVAVDLINRTVLWRVTASFVGTPATDGSAVYALLGNAVKAYSGSTGALLATYTGSGTLGGQPLVLNDIVLAANPSNTFVFDKASSALRTTLPSGGAVSYAKGVVYTADTTGKLARYNVQLATPEPTPAPTATPTATPIPTSTPAPTATPTPTPTATPSATPTPSPGASPTPTPGPNPAQPLWIDAKAAGNIVYFIFQGTAPHLERFDMVAGAWLASVPLSGAPTAIAVDASGIYVSFGRRTARLTLDGSSEMPLVNTVADVTALVIGGEYLYLDYGGSYSGAQFSSINKNTGVARDAKNFFYGMAGLSIAPSKNKIFGRSTGISPSDIVQLTTNADGTLGSQTDSPYHGSYPDASRTFVFPNESKVADNAGIIYNTTDLSYVNSFGGAFDDLAFSADRSVILRSGILIGYSNTFLETGRYTLTGSPVRIFVNGDSVYSFYRGDARGVFQAKTALASLLPGTPGEPIDPTALPYTPESIILGEDGVIYLLSRGNFSVFRWSVPNRQYLPTIPLTEAPTYIAYSTTNHALYLAYPGGKISRIKPSESLAEVPFANLPQSPLGLATAGEFIFASDSSGAWNTHYIFGADGTLRSSEDWNYYSTEYIWNAANRKMYFFRDDTSPNDILWENIDLEGVLGAEGESPYHDSTGFVHPIRVKPDGSVVLLGSGRIFTAVTLTLTNALSNDIADADWLNSNLFTVRPLGSGTQLQSWASNYLQSGAVTLSGTPLRLLAVGQKLEAITLSGGTATAAEQVGPSYPMFSELDSSLNVLFQTQPPGVSPTPTPSPSPTPTVSPSPTPAPTPTPVPGLLNISTRGNVQTGDNVMIAGFIIQGAAPKKILIRTLGPQLAASGLANVLANPTLQLYKPDGSVVFNDDWKDSQQSEIEQSHLAPTFDFEPAIVATLDPGPYTAVVRGRSEGTGIGLVEVYDLSGPAASRLANISTRGWVQTGDDVLIGGFIVGGGSQSGNVLVRALGPSLTGQGVSGALQDTTLALHDSNGNVINNDDWATSQSAEISATHLAPDDLREAAIYGILAPGNYTAIVRGKGSTSGVGLIEVYQLP